MALINNTAFADSVRQFSPAQGTPQHQSPAALPLSGGPAAAFANHQPAKGSGIGSAAKANIAPRQRPHLMWRIANRCLQVEASLATGGAGDNRDVWYLGNISLATGCDEEDGRDYAHRLSVNGPSYTMASLDKLYDQAKTEIESKGLGKPTCAKYNEYRQGICPMCPFWQKITSPYTLGVEDFELPEGYILDQGFLFKLHKDKDGNEDNKRIVATTADKPKLVKLPEGHRLEYTHQPGQFVYFNEVLVPENGAAQFFAKQHITLQPYEAKLYREFLVAWIKHLKEMMLVHDRVEPFTWTEDGFAVATRLYRPDGGVDPIVCGDPSLAANYSPAGTQAAWSAAANAVARDRVDIQIVMASAFAAPLVQLGGFGGGLVGAAFAPSGYAKSTAAAAGQTVWGVREGMLQLDDTPNYTAKILGTLHSMPIYLDELASATDEERKKFVRMLFRVSLGTDKHRLDRNVNAREVGSWQSMCMLTTNDALMDILITETGNRTDAAALRLFAFPITSMYKGQTDTMLLNQLASNHGTAGEVYAAWLAQNRDLVKASFTQLTTLVSTDFNPEPGERFYVGFVVCNLLGASFAERLGLVKFDLTSMYSFLKTTFIKLRIQRGVEIISTLRAADVLDRFIASHQAEQLVTDVMVTQLNNKAVPNNIRSPSPHAKRVEVHIALNDKLLRINRDTFIEWCTSKNIQWGGILEQMQTQWQANTNKRRCTIGKSASTRWTYTARCIEIQLFHLDLAHILENAQTPHVMPAGMAPALMPPVPMAAQ